jgi:hypothetical protein
VAENAFTADWHARHLAKLDGAKQKIVATQPAAVIAPRQKFGAKSETVDGHFFRSGKEARRYEDLRLLARVGAIRDLELQPRFEIIHRTVLCGHYTADFRYHDLRSGKTVVEDVKGGKATKTEAYQLRKRLMDAEGVFIVEV